MKNIKKALISLMTCTIIISIMSTFALTTSAMPAWGADFVLYEDPECTKVAYFNGMTIEVDEPEYHTKAGKEYYLKITLYNGLPFPFYCEDIVVEKDVITKGDNCMIFSEDDKRGFFPQIRQYGDVDDNDTTDTSDALCILKRCAKMENDGITVEKSADVDQNGEINSLDALEMLKKIAGLTSWERTEEKVSSFNFIVKE